MFGLEEPSQGCKSLHDGVAVNFQPCGVVGTCLNLKGKTLFMTPCQQFRQNQLIDIDLCWSGEREDASNATLNSAVDIEPQSSVYTTAKNIARAF